MRIVVWIPVEAYKRAILEQVSGTPGAELVGTDGPAQVATALEGAQGIISGGASKYTAEGADIIRTKGTSRRWFQAVAAGNDGLVEHGIRPGITVTGTAGNSAPA